MKPSKTAIAIIVMILLALTYARLDYTPFDYSNVERTQFDCEYVDYNKLVHASPTQVEHSDPQSISQTAPKPSESPSNYVPVKTVEVLATGYYGPTKDQPRYRLGTYHREILMNGEGKKTFYGTKPRIGIVATDPRIFEKGTLMLIKDPRDGKEKIFIAEDTGGRIKGKRIDIFTGFGMPGLISAEKIGMQKVSVIILKERSA